MIKKAFRVSGFEWFSLETNNLKRFLNGAVAQLGEHLLCKQGVTGSIPVSSTKICLMLGANHDTVIITFNGIHAESYLAPNIEQRAREAATRVAAARAANSQPPRRRFSRTIFDN